MLKYVNITVSGAFGVKQCGKTKQNQKYGNKQKHFS